MEYLVLVIGVYLDFISENDFYVYLIDEVFLDLISYLVYYKKIDVELV